MTEAQQRNRENLIAYFEAGCKTRSTLGFELEHILLHRDNNAPVSYTEPGGIHDVLERLSPHYRKLMYEGDQIVGLVRCYETITIEPAGQLEISAGPYETVAEVEKGYASFRRLLDPVLEEFGLYAPLVGYNPSSKAADLELVPKHRYKYMSEFLGKQAYSAICMMRGTASLQVSVDYNSEEDALRKLRVAEKLTPILALICDNVAVFETEAVHGHLARTGVWSGMWQDRVGIIPGSLDPAYGFADYADYIMTREAILVPDSEDESGWRYVGAQTFDEIYADRIMTDEELEHALSMVWPDARIKQFVEIRPADAMPPAYSFAYTALIRSIFYNAESLAQLDAELAHVDFDAIHAAKAALMANGYEAEVYGKAAAVWADLLIELAHKGASEEDLAYLKPLAQLIEARQTLAQQ